MRRYKKHRFIILISLALISAISGCLKPELPLNPHQRGSVTEVEVTMESNYKYQVYFDFSTGAVAGQNLKMDWDLGFETGDKGHHIIVNSSKAMFAADAGAIDFYTLIDTTGMRFNWDAQNGDLDSTALSGWADLSGTQPVPSKHVFVLNLGLKTTGLPVGLKKISIENYANGAYTLHWAELDNSNEDSLLIPASDTSFNFSFFSFKNGGDIVSIEPPKTSWDIVFTQYLRIFNVSGDTIPYLVTGVLLNPWKVEATADSSIAFDALDFSRISQFEFSNDRNLIGYDWKKYSFDLGQYAVNPDKIYVVRDPEGIYYKLHFIDFYDPNGNKGNPQFEFQKL